MSNKNNVNKDFYTIQGGDKRNADRVLKAMRQTDEPPQPQAKTPNFIPGALPVGESPPRTRRRARKAKSSRPKAPRPQTARSRRRAA
jgi:hypothetical protein